MNDLIDFQKFSKIPRLSREIVVSEKIDGTNAQVVVFDTTDFLEYINIDHLKEISPADKRDRLNRLDRFIREFCLYEEEIVPYKYALYVFAGSRKRWLNLESDNYGFANWVKENAKELTNLGKGRHFGEYYGKDIQRNYGLQEKRFALFNIKRWGDPETRPACCGVVPALWRGMFDTKAIELLLQDLETEGSQAVTGFMRPEGIVIYHTASGRLFKKTIVDDEKPKSQIE